MFYQLPNGSVTVCECFRDAWQRYFVYLHDELAVEFLRTHREKVEGKRLLKLAFKRFASGINPVALKKFFPSSASSSYEQSIIDGKCFSFGNHEIKPPELDESFWNLPEKVFQFQNKICEVCTGRVPTHYYCHEMYGSSFAQVYGAWIKAELVRQGYISEINGISLRKLWNHEFNPRALYRHRG